MVLPSTEDHAVPSISGVCGYQEIRHCAVEVQRNCSRLPKPVFSDKKYKFNIRRNKRKKANGHFSQRVRFSVGCKWRRWKEKCDRKYDAAIKKNAKDRKQLRAEQQELLALTQYFADTIRELYLSTREIRQEYERRRLASFTNIVYDLIRRQ